MRVAVSMYSYFRYVRTGELGVGAFIRAAKEAGAEGVELLAPFFKDYEADHAAALDGLAESGLPCPLFSVSQNFAKLDPSLRAAEVEKIKFGVDEALKLGAGVVRVFAGDVAEGISFDQARAWIIEGLTEGSRYAAAAGIKLALENHGKLAGRGDQVRGIIEEVRAKSGSNTLGANPDIGNFLLVDQDSVEAISQVASLSNMAHFKDFKAIPVGAEGAFLSLAGKPFTGAVVGEGDLDLSGCVAALRTGGFDGWCSVEYEGSEDPYSAIPRSITASKIAIAQ